MRGLLERDGVLDLLNDLRRQKEKQRRESRRGALCIGFGVLAFLIFLAGIRSAWSGSHAGTAGVHGERTMHCYFLLDRTGSMRAIRSAVVEGFDSYVREQQQQPGSMLLTLAQFNSATPLDIQFEGRDIHAVTPLRAYEPDGSTPLYDALALLIDHASKAAQVRAKASVSEPADAGSEIVVVVFTDGRENASRRHSREQVFKLIEAKRKEGWVFVFLGANQVSKLRRATAGRAAVCAAALRPPPPLAPTAPGTHHPWLLAAPGHPWPPLAAPGHHAVLAHRACAWADFQ